MRDGKEKTYLKIVCNKMIYFSLELQDCIMMFCMKPITSNWVKFLLLDANNQGRKSIKGVHKNEKSLLRLKNRFHYVSCKE